MIDSTIFAVDVPAGSYTEGQEISMPVIFGPSVVRDGYGAAILKQVMIFATNSNVAGYSYCDFKNSNWNDSLKTMVSIVSGNSALTAFAKTSPVIQKCGDIELQPNSSFDVKFVVGATVTTTVDTTIVCLMDIDYPSVAAVANPRDEKGTPVSIVRHDTIVSTVDGSAASLTWTTINVDEFKAGYRYLLAQVGLFTTSSDIVGFVAFSGAPSMNGLVRVIPVIPRVAVASRLELDYSTPLVKGPMNISYATLGAGGSVLSCLECDYIRR